MTTDARISRIQEKVEALIEEAVAILEENYDMDSFEDATGAYEIMLNLNSVLVNLDEIDEEGLKIED
jgi:3-methyladenine DNA glycosylase Tag